MKKQLLEAKKQELEAQAHDWIRKQCEQYGDGGEGDERLEEHFSVMYYEKIIPEELEKFKRRIE